MSRPNESSDGPSAARSDVTADLRRTAWLSAATLAAIALSVVALSFLEDTKHHWIHTVEPVLVLAALLWFFRQNIAKARALETSNLELAEAVSAAEVARARAEAETRQKARLAALLDAALDNAPVAFAFFDRQLRFLRVTETFAKITGLSPADHIGQTLYDIDPRVAAQVEPKLRQALSTQRPLPNVEFHMATPTSGGEPRDLLSSYYPIVMHDGELLGVGSFVVDMTEIKHLEEQLVQAQKMEAVGRLAGGVAHDFNNLLTVISSYAELVQFDPLMEDREELKEIRGAAARAAKLTRQLLAFSRRQAMEPRIVNPNDILRGVESLLRRLIDGNIGVHTSLSTDTPLIRVDPGQLEQVVMNLAINAADAMPEGGSLSIETSSVQLGDEFVKHDPDLVPGSYAMIQVRDTGTGIDPVTLAQIFEPFFTTKEPGRGTGLGLSTVYGIVKQSSGTVSVDSTLGAGTVFSVYLPAVGDPEEDGMQ